MKFRNPFFVYLPVVAAMFFFSYSFIWYKQVFIYYDPVTLVVFRLVIAVPLLFILSLTFRKLQKIQSNHLKLFMLLAFFEPFLYFLGECYGVNLISSTLASIIISLIPLIVPIPAWYIFRERFTVVNFIGLFISIAGVLLVIIGEPDGGPVSVWGVLLMFIAVFAAVCHSIFVRKLAEQYNTFTIVTYQNAFGLLYFIPLFGFMGFREFIHMQHTFQMILPVIKLAVFASTIAFLLFVYSIQKIGMARSNVFINLIPVFTAVLSWLILKEGFSLLKISGIIVVIAGLVFSQVNHQIRVSGKKR
jgi:drug/metabolite transporter (DMT)-like permease